MKMKISALLFLVSITASSFAFATPEEDAAWISKCQTDNKKEGAAPETVTKYCTCMNGKMSDEEKLSISAWEGKHPAEMKACEAEAGWK